MCAWEEGGEHKEGHGLLFLRFGNRKPKCGPPYGGVPKATGSAGGSLYSAGFRAIAVIRPQSQLVLYLSTFTRSDPAFRIKSAHSTRV
jgi:hypothetical protein